METLVLSKKDVAACLSPEDFLNHVEYVFREWGNGNVVQPAKITLDMSRSGVDSWSNAMPAFIVPLEAAGIKWAGGYIENPKKDLPYVMATIVLIEPTTGQVLSFMDGSLITNYRTGAVAAISAKHLSRRNVGKIAIIGAGTQGRTSITCLSYLYRNAEVAVADISEQKRTAFQEEMGAKLGMKIRAVASVEEAVREADIIVLVTTASKPLVSREWVQTGATVLGMGSYQQMDDAFSLQADKIIVDSWAQTSHRGEIAHLAEKGKITESSIYAEIGEVVAGKKPGREGEEENILVVPVGLGAHDVCAAYHAFQKARERNLGIRIDLGLETDVQL
jgi:ornithine cyclodeaminase/alanine dehydrogenase